MDGVIFEKYQIVSRLGKGAYGEVYEGRNAVTNEPCAMKLEQRDTKIEQLIYESKIYRMLQGGKGIPNLHWFGIEDEYHVLIIDKLGLSLKQLYDSCEKKFSLKTTLMLADEMISRLEYFHSKELLHRDIKPANFMMGRGKLEQTVFIIDYGFVKRYKDPATGKHIPFKTKKKNNPGTPLYTSLDTDSRNEQGRKDDMESLGYVLIEFMKGGLPWKGDDIEQQKKKTTIEELCQDLPGEFATYVKYCRSLSFTDRPDYSFLRKLLQDLYWKHYKVWDLKFDWPKYSFSAAYQCVFLRHGESTWNKENRFTGWTDVTLTENGKGAKLESCEPLMRQPSQREAANAGKILKEKGFEFDIVYTSVLTRAIQTYNLASAELGCQYLPITRSWRLNERHYGALQGLNKAETAAKHGEDQVKIWRRSYSTPPPALDFNDERHPRFDSRYKNVPKGVLPLTECLEDTVARVLPFWIDNISSSMLQGQRPFVVAHGNSLRAIVKYLDNVSEKDILELNIPTAVPLVYEFDENLKPIRNYYLADESELKAKMASVANQGKAK